MPRSPCDTHYTIRFDFIQYNMIWYDTTWYIATLYPCCPLVLLTNMLNLHQHHFIKEYFQKFSGYFDMLCHIFVRDFDSTRKAFKQHLIWTVITKEQVNFHQAHLHADQVKTAATHNFDYWCTYLILSEFISSVLLCLADKNTSVFSLPSPDKWKDTVARYLGNHAVQMN